MNIKLIKEKWIKYYKRGFLTGLFVLSFICLIDQVLQSPFFFNKIDLFALSFILIWLRILWIAKFDCFSNTVFGNCS